MAHPLDRTTDMATYVALLVERLQVHALAVRALGAAPEPDPRAAQAVAHGIEEVAEALGALPPALCERCRLADVTERSPLGAEGEARP